MNRADDTSEGLAALLADVLSEGAPDPALLVRYADDPSVLSPEERQMVERRLAESPQIRDQLEVLKRFDFSKTREPSDRESRSWLTNALAQIHRLFKSRPLVAGVPTIAIAALALLMIYPGASSILRLLGGSPGPAPPIALAVAMPKYRAPEGAAPRHRSGLVGAIFGSKILRRDRPSRIMALAPEHVGQTAFEAPSLYWYLSEIPEAGGFAFWIGSADEGSVAGQPSGASAGKDSGTWIPKELPSPNQPGLQRILLSEYGVALEAGVEYSWIVSSGLDDYAIGWIKRVELPAAVAKRLTNASLGDAPAIYAEARLWYDALSSLLELFSEHPNNESLGIARSPELFPEAFWHDALSGLPGRFSEHPNNESLRTARRELLRQGGLEAVDEALAVHER